MSQAQLNLAQQANKAMVAGLVELARAGVSESYYTRYNFEVTGHGMRQRQLDQSPVQTPSQFRTQGRGISSGVFVELTMTEVFNLCFTPEAFALLIKHAYNDYVFWHNIIDFCQWFFSAPLEMSLPFSEELVEKRLFPSNRTPFGVKTSTYSDFHMSRLTDAVRANGGVFDPNKLPAPYAVHLLMSGFLLNVKQEDYAAPPSLMVSPMWQHVVDEIVASAQATTTTTSTPTSTVPAQSAAPAPVRGILYAKGTITGAVELELLPGYSAKEVLDLLNSGKAQIRYDAVLVAHEAPAEGYMNVAKVINPVPSCMSANPLKWSTEKPEADSATTADVAEPTSNRFKLSALGLIYGEIEVEVSGNRGLNEIAQLLTQYRAQISDGSVVIPHAPPAEGMSVIAKIVSKKQFPTPVGTVVWSFAG